LYHAFCNKKTTLFAMKFSGIAVFFGTFWRLTTLFAMRISKNALFDKPRFLQNMKIRQFNKSINF